MPHLTKGHPVTHFTQTIKNAAVFNESAMYKMVAATYAHRDCFEDYNIALKESEQATWRMCQSKLNAESRRRQLKYAQLIKQACMLMFRSMYHTLQARERAADADYENLILRMNSMYRDMSKFWKHHRRVRAVVLDRFSSTLAVNESLV